MAAVFVAALFVFVVTNPTVPNIAYFISQVVKETAFIFAVGAGSFVTVVAAAVSRLIAAAVRRGITVVAIGVTVLVGITMAVLVVSLHGMLLVHPVPLVAFAVIIRAGIAIPGITDAVAPA